MDRETFALFLELYRDLPRHGPGGTVHTHRALSLIRNLPPRPRIIDLGCGLGPASLDLLAATDGTVVAVDQLPASLEGLKKRAVAAGVADRLTIIQGDMAALPPAVQPASFHLVWSEAAAYSMGFDEALRTWRDLLVPGGAIALSELTWRVEEAEAPVAAREFFEKEYPRMRQDAQNRDAFRRFGFELTGTFFLPDAAWWDPYYTPLEKRIEGFLEAHEGDARARSVAESAKEEIEVRRAHGEAYAYAFYVGTRRS